MYQLDAGSVHSHVLVCWKPKALQPYAFAPLQFSRSSSLFPRLNITVRVQNHHCDCFLCILWSRELQDQICLPRYFLLNWLRWRLATICTGLMSCRCAMDLKATSITFRPFSDWWSRVVVNSTNPTQWLQPQANQIDQPVICYWNWVNPVCSKNRKSSMPTTSLPTPSPSLLPLSQGDISPPVLQSPTHLNLRTAATLPTIEV